MFPVMTSANRLNGYLFCLMMAAMLIYSLPSVVGFARNQTDALTLFMDGKLLRKFEQRYDREIFLREPSVKLWASLHHQLFDEGLSGVVLGRDGWLYTNQEYLVPNDLEQNLRSHVEKIVAIREQLQQHGKQLIILPVPMKVDIYAEHARLPDPRAVSLHDQFVAALRAENIVVTPVREAFLAQRDGDTLFLKTDTHWSPRGARLAAFELARQQPDLVGERAYTSRLVEEKTVAGDLMNYIRFNPALTPEQFSSQQVPIYETLVSEQAIDDDSLFGDASESIALVGSSYSKIDDWNFTGFLKEALRSDLITMAVEAKGPVQAMDEFLKSAQLQNEEIGTVIWEFPVRTVLAQRNPTKSWQLTQPHHF